MDTATIVLIVVLVLLVAALLAWLAARRKKSAALKDRFGPEYDRTLDDTGKRRQAERELQERAQRRESLDIRPLDPVRRDGYARRWRQTQEDFVDHPAEAVTAAQALVTDVMRERGYPVGDHQQQMKDLSVDHADVMDNYRAAHEIAELNESKQATTEQLRRAMVHYRTLFGRLLDDGRAADDDATDRPVAQQPDRPYSEQGGDPEPVRATAADGPGDRTSAAGSGADVSDRSGTERVTAEGEHRQSTSGRSDRSGVDDDRDSRGATAQRDRPYQGDGEVDPGRSGSERT